MVHWQVFDDEGKDRTPKPMLGQPLMQAARGVLPMLGESFQAGGGGGGGGGGLAGDSSQRESVVGGDHGVGSGPPTQCLPCFTGL